MAAVVKTPRAQPACLERREMMCSSLRRLAERKDSISCILPQAFFMELIYADFTLLQVC